MHTDFVSIAETGGRMGTGRRNIFRNSLVAFFAVFLLSLIFHARILNYISSSLVRSDAIESAEAIVVLAGDGQGERMMSAIELYKSGMGKKIVFWGGQLYWKITWAELYMRQLKEGGIPEADLIWSEEKLAEHSTVGEAMVNVRLMEENGIKSFILVTSPYHTSRAGMVYEKQIEGKGMRMYVHPSADSIVKIEDWWKDRQSAKLIYLELNKTIYYLFKN